MHIYARYKYVYSYMHYMQIFAIQNTCKNMHMKICKNTSMQKYAKLCRCIYPTSIDLIKKAGKNMQEKCKNMQNI